MVEINRDEMNLIVSMKIKKCNGCYDVCELLNEVREHERGLI